MTWQPGTPLMTAADQVDWQAWRKASKLHAQRQRRLKYRRIDYYASDEAQAVIDSRTGRRGCGDYSSVIDALVIAGAEELPEYSGRK